MFRYITAIVGILYTSGLTTADSCTFCKPTIYPVNKDEENNKVTVVNQILPLTTPKPKKPDPQQKQIDYAVRIQQQLIREAIAIERRPTALLRTFRFHQNIGPYTPRPLNVQAQQIQRKVQRKVLYGKVQQSFAIRNGQVFLNIPIHDKYEQTRIYNKGGQPISPGGPVIISSKSISYK